MARALSLTASPPLTKIHSKTLPICPFLPPSFPLRPFTFSISSRRAPISITCSSRNAPPARVRAPSRSLSSEGRDEDESRLVCPGCGIFMQDSDPNLPGFYQKPTAPASKSGGSDIHISDPDDVFNDEGDELANGSASKSSLVTEIEGLMEDSDDPDDFLSDSDEFYGEEDEETDGSKTKSKLESEFDGFSDWEEEFGDEDEKLKEELDGFTPAGVGYGNVTEETLKKLKKEKISRAEKKRKAREAKMNEEEEAVTVCARCHSLRNYGQVKNPNAENLIPDFDFDRLISTRLMKPATSAPLVVMVVDCVDFDGSFPKRAAKSLFKALEGSKKNPKLRKVPKLVLVATKVDLLPSQISPTRLDRWVRNRAKAAGAPHLSGVYLVSARKDIGVRNLLSFIKDSAGPRGNVWVIGAQNAGKSTLINAFTKKEGVKVTRLTEAAIPCSHPAATISRPNPSSGGSMSCGALGAHQLFNRRSLRPANALKFAAKAVTSSWRDVCDPSIPPPVDRHLLFIRPSADSGGELVGLISDPLVAATSSRWHNTIVVHVLGDSLFYSQIKAVASHLWRPRAEMRVYARGNRFFYFWFADGDDCDAILAGGPYFFDGNLIILRCWSPVSSNDR